MNPCKRANPILARDKRTYIMPTNIPCATHLSTWRFKVVPAPGHPFPRKSSPPRPLRSIPHRRPGAAAASTPGNPGRHPRHGSPGSPAPAGPASATSITSSAAATGCCWCGRRTKAAGSRCPFCAWALPTKGATQASEPCSRQSADPLAAAQTHPRSVRPGVGAGGVRRDSVNGKSPSE